MKTILSLILIFFLHLTSYSQILESPCSRESMLERHLKLNPNAEEELAENEKQIKAFIKRQQDNPQNKSDSEITIPVVMHVFHLGDDGKMDMEQALSGLEILNNDFNGLNDGWNTIDPEFDTIKGTLDINFCLASIDPDGNPTTGLIYHEDADALNNQGDLFQHAWDNYKYLNIYFPKYTQGEPSDFTAYAFFPNTSNTNSNTDGIFYSSIRWGYGNHSELTEGQDWASVCTHEVGHWLNLWHTFQNGCDEIGDFVDDTPPTVTSGIELSGCNNNDFSCGVHTNGENFMDYNHDCKKMFTQGQIDRMTAALNLPSRVNLWTPSNLMATGCMEEVSATEEFFVNPNILQLSPNPAFSYVEINLKNKQKEAIKEICIYNVFGQIIFKEKTNIFSKQVNVSDWVKGLYIVMVNNQFVNKLLIE